MCVALTQTPNNAPTFYDWISCNYNVFPARDETAKIKEKLTKDGFVTAIQHIKEIIRYPRINIEI